MMNIILLALVCAACSFGIVFFLTPSVSADAALCVPAEGEAAHAAPLAKADQAYVELKEILITIGNEPATRYVKMNVSIVTEKGKTADVTNAEPMLVDAFVTYLRSLELADFESAGFYPRMREQMAHRSELVLGGDISRGVLITEFLLR